jgi:hypothetical protein
MFQPKQVILGDGQLQRNTFMVNVDKDVHKYSYYTVLCVKIMLKCIKYISLHISAKISDNHLCENWHLHSKGVIS